MMREMNLSDAIIPRNHKKRVKIITTQASSKVRSDEEMILLMKSARNRFRKAVASGRIQIVSNREWTLR